MNDQPVIYMNWNYFPSSGTFIQMVTQEEYDTFKNDCEKFGLHVMETIITAQQGGLVQILAISSQPVSTEKVFSETRAWMVERGMATMPEDTAAAEQAFKGETMHCIMCRKKQQHVPGVESNWTLMQVDGDGYYVCPTCLQDSPYVKKTGNYAGQYERVLRRIMSLRERLN